MLHSAILRPGSPASLRCAALAACALIACTATPALHAQESTFGEVIDVRVVNLEVVVTDKAGNRVGGLGPDDFVLRIDNREVPIDYFTEVRDGVATAPEGESAVLSARPAGEPVGTSYLVFIDDFFSIGKQRNQVLRELQEELSFLRPEDRMAVVAFDGERLTLLTTWEDRPSEIKKALDAAIERPSSGLFRTSTRWSHGMDRLPGTASVAWDFEAEASAIVSTLRGFAQPPGRKILLLLAGNWPRFLTDKKYDLLDRPRLNENGDLAYSPFLSGFRVRNSLRAFDSISQTANLLGYTIYPLDVAGLRGVSSHDASQRELPPVLAPVDTYRQIHLRQLAAQTGGRPLLASNRLRALETVVEDTRSYYWLGISANRQADDSSHRIDVRARRPGLEIRTRQRYLDLSRDSEVSMLVESALLFGDLEAIAMPSRLSVVTGKPRRAGMRKVMVPIEVKIPLDDVTVLPTADGWVTDLDLRFAVLDKKGSKSEVPIIDLHLPIGRKPTPGAYVVYETALEMRRLPHDVIVSLHDKATGQLLMTKLAVSP